MRDPDDALAHEHRQQLVVERVIDSLHGATRDLDHIPVFYGIAHGLLDVIASDKLPLKSDNKLVIELILPPVLDFVTGQKDQVEANLLFMYILKKVIDSLSSRVQGAYLRREILAEAAGQ